MLLFVSYMLFDLRLLPVFGYILSVYIIATCEIITGILHTRLHLEVRTGCVHLNELQGLDFIFLSGLFK